jgi:hypothetical protein
LGDSHIIDVAERLAIKLTASLRTIGYVKPNAGLNNITSTGKSEIENLSKYDVVLICGGTLDVAKNNTSKGLSSVLQFVTDTEHTNVIIIDAPHRFDLEAS